MPKLGRRWRARGFREATELSSANRSTACRVAATLADHATPHPCIPRAHADAGPSFWRARGFHVERSEGELSRPCQARSGRVAATLADHATRIRAFHAPIPTPGRRLACARVHVERNQGELSPRAKRGPVCRVVATLADHATRTLLTAIQTSTYRLEKSGFHVERGQGELQHDVRRVVCVSSCCAVRRSCDPRSCGRRPTPPCRQTRATRPRGRTVVNNDGSLRTTVRWSQGHSRVRLSCPTATPRTSAR
jgi:hypothetical protein